MVFVYLLKAIYMQKTSEFDFFQLCRRFAILFDSSTDLLLITSQKGVRRWIIAKSESSKGVL